MIYDVMQSGSRLELARNDFIDVYITAVIMWLHDYVITFNDIKDDIVPIII